MWNPDGSFSYDPVDNWYGTDTFTYRAFDGVAWSDNATVTLTVVPSNTPLTVEAGPDRTIDEGSVLAQTGGWVDPDASVWTATVDYGDGSGLASLSLNADKTFELSHAYDDNGVYTVTVTISNGDGCVGSDTMAVTVNNVGPTATVGNSGPVNEGSPVTVSLIDAFDPSSADTAAGFHYSFATSVGRLGDDVCGCRDGPSRSFTFNDNGTPTVYGRIFDKDGGFTDYQTVVTVNNVAPTATIGNSGPVHEGNPVTVSLIDAFDPSSADTTAGFHYSFATSSAGLATTYAGAVDGPSRSFTFDDNGTPTVYGRIFDKDGGFTDYQTVVTVHNVAPTATIGNSGPVTRRQPGHGQPDRCVRPLQRRHGGRFPLQLRDQRGRLGDDVCGCRGRPEPVVHLRRQRHADGVRPHLRQRRWFHRLPDGGDRTQRRADGDDRQLRSGTRRQPGHGQPDRCVRPLQRRHGGRFPLQLRDQPGRLGDDVCGCRGRSEPVVHLRRQRHADGVRPHLRQGRRFHRLPDGGDGTQRRADGHDRQLRSGDTKAARSRSA